MSRLRKDASDAPESDLPLLPGPGSTSKPLPTPLSRFVRLLRTRPVTSLVVATIALFCGGVVIGGARAIAALVEGGREVRDGVLAAEEAVVARVGAAVGRGGAGQVVADFAEGGCHRLYPDGFLGKNGSTVCVTDEFFFEIAVDEEKLGRIVIGVFGREAPKSARNFRALATCSGVFEDLDSCYRGDGFHRIVKGFVVQGGRKATGRSVYGPTFREEVSAEKHTVLEHREKGVVSWAEYPIGSQFFILSHGAARHLDANHVVFGFVTEGLDVLEKMASVPTEGDKPTVKLTIVDSGDLHGSH